MLATHMHAEREELIVSNEGGRAEGEGKRKNNASTSNTTGWETLGSELIVARASVCWVLFVFGSVM